MSRSTTPSDKLKEVPRFSLKHANAWVRYNHRTRAHGCTPEVFTTPAPASHAIKTNNFAAIDSRWKMTSRYRSTNEVWLRRTDPWLLSDTDNCTEPKTGREGYSTASTDEASVHYWDIDNPTASKAGIGPHYLTDREAGVKKRKERHTQAAKRDQSWTFHVGSDQRHHLNYSTPRPIQENAQQHHEK